MYYVIGRARHRRGEDMSWPSSPIEAVSCTEDEAGEEEKKERMGQGNVQPPHGRWRKNK